MNLKTKKTIAREGLILLVVMFISILSYNIANNLLSDHYTIFNYKCTYRDDVQTLDIVEYLGKSNQLKATLWRGYVEQTSQILNEMEKELADWTIFNDNYRGYPKGFKVENLPRAYSSLGLLKIILFYFSVISCFLYILYVLRRYYVWTKEEKSEVGYKSILIKEGKIIAWVLSIWIFAFWLSYIIGKISMGFGQDELLYPTQQKTLIKDMVSFLLVIPIVYVNIQLIRYVKWSIKILKGN